MTDIAELEMRFRSIEARQAKADMDRLADSAARTEKKAQDVETASKRLGGTFRSLAGIAGTLAVSVGAVFSSQAVLSEIIAFDGSMSRVAAVTRATASELDLLRETAKEMGAATRFSAAEAAEGLSFLGMAGFTAAQAASALPGVLDLAAAAGMGLGQAADVASNIMSAFGVAATESAAVADLLAAASSRANTDVAQLGEAMKYVGPVASAMGVSMSDTAAAVGALSNAGIQGGMAGTTLRRILSALVAPTKGARDAMAELGLTAADLDPQVHSLSTIMETLAGTALDASSAMAIAGQEGGPGLLALVSQRDGLAALEAQLRDVTGEAGRMSRTMSDNLGGDIRTFQSALAALSINLGEAGLTGAMRGAVQALTEGVRWLGDVGARAEELGVVVTVLAATRLPALTASLYATASALAATTTATGVLTGAVSLLGRAVALAGGPWGVLLGLVTAAAGAMLVMRDNSTSYKAQVDLLKTSHDALNAALGDYGKTLAPTAGAAAVNAARDYALQAAAAREAAAAELAFMRAQLARAEAEAGAFVGGGAQDLVTQRQRDELAAARANFDEANEVLRLAVLGVEQAKLTVAAGSLKSAAADVGTVVVEVAGVRDGITDVGTAAVETAPKVEAAFDKIGRAGEQAGNAFKTSWQQAFTSFVTGASNAEQAASSLLSSLANTTANRAFDALWSIGSAALGAAFAPAASAPAGFSLGAGASQSLGFSLSSLGTGTLAGATSFAPSGVGSLGAISGGSSLSLAGASAANPLRFLPGNANGTEQWRGGPTIVGERGPEIVSPPRGSRITPNDRMGGGQLDVRVYVDESGNWQAAVERITEGVSADVYRRNEAATIRKAVGATYSSARERRIG